MDTAVASRCSEPGCVWPQYEDGICLRHLREREDPLPYLQIETASMYSDVGNLFYGAAGIKARTGGLRIYDSED